MEDDSPCSDEVLNALLVRLVDATLSELRRLHYPPHGTQQLATQLEAAAWLYYCNFQRSYPGLDYYDSSEFCKKAVILRCGLDNYLDKENGVIESRVSAACKAADYCSSDTAVTRAAVLLLSPDRQRCLLVKSLITKCHWSLIEMSVNQGEGVLEAALSAVEKIAGLDSGCFQVEEKFYHARCMSQQGNFTRLYVVVQKAGTETRGSLEVSWITLEELISKANSALLTKNWEWEPTPALDYFHIHPFVTALRDVSSRSVDATNLPASLTKTPSTVKAEPETERAENLHKENECDLFQPSPSSITPTKRKISEIASKEEQQPTTIVLDSEDEADVETKKKKSCSRNNQAVQDISISHKRTRSFVKAEGVTTDHSKIDKITAAGTTTKIENSVPISPVTPTKDSVVRSPKSPSSELFSSVAGNDCSALALAVKQQQERFQKLMELQSQVAIYNAQSAALHKELSDGEAELHSSLQNHLAASMKDIPGIASFLSNLRDPVQDLEEFCVKNGWPKPRYDIQTAPFKTTQFIYTVVVHLSGPKVQHSEKGSHSIELQAAKHSAASTMLGRLYLLKSKLV